MTIGLYNIFTTLWFLLMFICGGVLTYITIDRGFFSSDVELFTKFIIGILVLITMGIAGFFGTKFRFLIIKDNKLTSIYPFILKKDRINFDQVVKIKWKTWTIKATIYRTIEIFDKNNFKTSISDFEFENFDTLVSKIPNADNDKNKEIVDLEQAKTNLYYMAFLVFMITGFLIAITWISILKNRSNWIIIAFYFVGFIIINSALKRRKKYKKIIKTAHNPL